MEKVLITSYNKQDKWVTGEIHTSQVSVPVKGVFL